MQGRRASVEAVPPMLVGAAATAVAVLGVATFSAAAPYVGLLDVMRAGLPGLAFATCSLAVALLGRARTGTVLLAVAAVGASAAGLSVGLQQRTSGWLLVAALTPLLAPAVVALVFAFPDGRLDRRDRVASVTMGVIGVVCALALAGTYDPATWGWCRCVASTVGGSSSPDAYLDVVDAVTVSEVAVLVVGVGLLLVSWRRHAEGIARAFGATFTLLAAAWVTKDVFGLVGTRPPLVLGIAVELGLVALPALYVAGFATRRPSRARVADLLVAARDEHDPVRLRGLVARAIGDPRAEVAWWDRRQETYLDHQGRPVEPVAGEVIVADVSGRPVAVVLSQHAGEVEPGVRDAVAQALLLAAENRRLTAELQASLEQVRESRARIISAADDTRRRIERNLHDGAQQLLISTGIKLNLAASRVEAGDTASLADVLEGAQAELNRALNDIRNLASGIAPTALVHGGLDSALRELAMQCAVPTTVRVTGSGQPATDAAATCYFVVAECLTNVVKHAGATRAWVDVDLLDPVVVRVRDDGAGGATLDSEGSGLRGLVDRVEARGGSLDVESGTGGTRVTARVPAERERVEP